MLGVFMESYSWRMESVLVKVAASFELILLHKLDTKKRCIFTSHFTRWICSITWQQLIIFVSPDMGKMTYWNQRQNREDRNLSETKHDIGVCARLVFQKLLIYMDFK